jgi:hypothetical protein
VIAGALLGLDAEVDLLTALLDGIDVAFRIDDDQPPEHVRIARETLP